MKLVFATHNSHKLSEVQRMLPPGLTLLTLDEIGCHQEIPETADTIEGNAIQKARYVKERYGYDTFADDTGLEVRALDNAPGVYSARYAGEAKDNEANINLLLENLQQQSDRAAQFKTIFALCLGTELYTFEGIVRGEITHERHGAGGFGYDAVFLPEGYKDTFAQMTQEQKNRISHRGRALQKLSAFLEQRNEK
ncbi:MAG: non-canonical purine NTP diphosphatase [Capnocytophaga sp.]|uniref:non-canonical purine NTP diphosphatase n=1 Tax=Capnocytophaga sp. oral taxon 863 TaxID=1227265 RepID=UPI0003970ED8|nr:non-canonical purine NTP diphosphatase [Capnocytophaga sp. oral taxon 863]ERI61830.1 non-canonical purine NTP pyrophosphatase, RdgB/HAM1 family [Capnocytophaga sp. oral taxon 863 str. F0517]RKW19465.1 MAG: non-canonical purine NTP diphosphatase [Capnocytophaga sp.]